MKLQITILISFLLSVLTASIISQVGSKTALVDHPNYRSSHSLPTPRGGGIGIWLAFVIIGFFFRSHLYQYLSNELKIPHWKVTLLYAVVQLCFGAIAVAAYQLPVSSR